MLTDTTSADLARIAALLDYRFTVIHNRPARVTTQGSVQVTTFWDPLGDDGDCARMEAALGIDLIWAEGRVVAYAEPESTRMRAFTEQQDAHHGDINKARRMASCRAALYLSDSQTPRP